ncbi:uncharacterized protein DUF4221 [Arcicella aurantiaca]|uniref:Uncharacterized protein DUF4221 n=1 Tax=Arcicella aurantiaca TaxID=591202 RepID=A0A316E2G2_9BACT|nr:DUF4221 family protein [Arcicella aurantiaca]PWK17070.1 uncharacterized protein DUF4221 [Arcicella aurantiaca]
MKYIYVISVLSCFLLNCKQVEKEKRKDIFVISDTLLIPVDNTVSAVGNYYNFNYKGKDGEVLVVPSLNNELLFFNMGKSSLIKKIRLQEEGPDGIGTFGNVNIVSEDSIIINGSNPLETYILDKRGSKLSTFSMAKNEDLKSRGIVGQPTTSLLWIDKKVIAFAQTNLLTNKLGENYYQLNVKALTALNTETSKYEMLPIKFPTNMSDGSGFWDVFHFTPSVAILNKSLYYTFPGSDSLYSFNLITNQRKQVSASSINLKEGNGVFEKNFTTITEMFKIYAENCSYVKILSDRYNNRIYRIIAHPTDKWKNSGNMNDVLISKPFSIQVFDTDLNFLGESGIFPKNSFDAIDSFVAEKGLYISNNHPSNPKVDEEHLSYSIFTLKK